METISACPHHGFDTWMLVNHFYGGMSPAMKQLLETMCGGDFLSKHPDEAIDFLNYLAETSKGWDEPNPREIERMRPPVNQRGGMYALTEEMEMKARISIGGITLTLHGDLTPLLMYPQVPNLSLVHPHSHNHHHPLLQWNKPY